MVNAPWRAKRPTTKCSTSVPKFWKLRGGISQEMKFLRGWLTLKTVKLLGIDPWSIGADIARVTDQEV